MSKISAIEIKALALAKGVSFTERFLSTFREPFLEKRRAYGNSDSLKYLDKSIPQEFYILPERIICAVNTRDDSDLIIDYLDGEFTLGTNNLKLCAVTFPIRPTFYNSTLTDGTLTRKIGTLYGGAALGLFVYGSCSLVQDNVGCKYCSIKPNKEFGRDFAHSLTELQVYEAVENAITQDPDKVSQIMINGGIFKDHNRGFLHYTRLCEAARNALDQHNSKVELHLISYPPNDLTLLQRLKHLNLSLAMNSEVFDKNLFNSYCPGKNQQHIRHALDAAVKILGEGSVYSICVGGLESLSSLTHGMRSLANSGITPVINIFHPDPLTELESYPAPRVNSILNMGKALQAIYKENSYMKPFYSDCGRNSIDSEAYKGLF